MVSYFKDQLSPYRPYNLQSINVNDSIPMYSLSCYTNEFINQSKYPDEMSPEELKDDCLARAQYWHPLFKSLIALAVAESVVVSHVKTQHKIKPWVSRNVTLLGDAAHR